MKKQLLFKQLKELKVLMLFAFIATINFSYAQNLWTGATDNLFMTTTNWTTVPLFNGTDNLRIVSTTNNPTLLNNSAAATPAISVVQFQTSVGTELTTASDITSTSTSLSVYIGGKLHITGGTFWGKGNIYFGNNTGELPYCNIETGGTLKTKAAILVGKSSACTVDVNGGTITGESGGGLSIGNYTSTGQGIVNVNSGGLIKIYKVSGFLVGTYGTCNLNNGGKIEEPAGDLAVKGTLNVNGGLVNLLSGASTINNTAAGAGVINLNSGTINIAGALNAINGTINIDAGSLILTGDQTTAMSTFISSNTIKLSAAAVTAGKILSNTYDLGTNKTTIIAISPPTTWTTTWSNGTPSASVEAIIDGTYSTTTNGSFTAKKLTVNTGKSLTINSGTTLTVQNEVVNNGTMIIENNANLIQVLGTTNTNTGNIVVNRNSSPLLRLDYTLWSSPVAGQNLAAFSPLTSQDPSRFYTYDTAAGAYSAIALPALTTTNFTAGTGYLIRTPNTANALTPTAYAGQFTGVPNNGNISVALSTGYNLVGNPYPSPISIATLMTDNPAISTTLYFWRTTNVTGTSAYCTYNTAGTPTFVSNGNTQSTDPAGIIQTGQGFFVQATAVGSLVFKNGQRAANTAGQFFKIKQVATPSRIWLNATNAAGGFSQMAVNYTEAATTGVDNYDSVYINDSPLALTSNINNEEYTIQGRPAFDATDVVPLNFKTDVAGNYTIAIDHSEGVFNSGQSVILVDATAGTETDLTTSAYTFTATTGTANSRFSLKYQKTLDTNPSVFSDNNVTVYKNKGTLYVNAGDATIANIKVYDVQGKLVTELKNVKATSATIANLKATNQVLVVKITSQENKVVTKKVVN